MSNSEYYEDKICIVTGANSGIGYAVSEELLKRGAVVYMICRKGPPFFNYLPIQYSYSHL